MKNNCKETLFEATEPEFADTGIARCIKCGHKIKIARILLEEMIGTFHPKNQKTKNERS